MKILKLMSLLLVMVLLAGCNIPSAPAVSTLTPTAVLIPATAEPAPTTAPTQPPVSTPTDPPPAVATETRLPEYITITLDPFPNGNVFTSPGPVWISGTTGKMPFEKVLTYQVIDASGNHVQQGPIMVSGEYGEPGAFNAKIEFPAGKTGSFTIRIVNHSARDGSEQGAAEVGVTLQ